MSALWNGLVGAMTSTFGSRNIVPTERILSSGTVRAYPQALHALMRALAGNTNAYKSIADVLSDYGLEGTALHGLRNPTNAVCGFYESNLWPGTIREDDTASALPLQTVADLATAEQLRAAIHRVWRWSNLNDSKDGAAYDAAMLGEQIFKIRSDRATRRAWFELLQPDYMTDLDVDGRGYLTYIRLDVPQVRRGTDGTTETFIHTEIWDKRQMRYRRWERSALGLTAVDQLGAPAEDEDMEQLFGVDFVPFVHWKFDRTSSDLRGVPAVMKALDKIIYGDALVTSLHQRLARHGGADWALVGTATDVDGFPVAPPVLGEGDGEVIDIGGGTFWRLPAGWRIESLVANIAFDAHLRVVQDHYQALREYDLHELTWGTISEAGDASGKALNYKLTPAKSKLEKARGRGEAALIRATQMCLSVAQKLEAPGFSESEIGTFDRGAFDFWVADRPIVPLSQQEQSELDTARVQRVKTWTDSGLSDAGAMGREGFSTDEIAKATQVALGPER